MSDCNSTRRTEQRDLKESNKSWILESLSWGKRISMRILRESEGQSAWMERELILR